MSLAKRNIWLGIGLIGALLAAPNSTVIKYAIVGTDPYLFNVLRFALIALVTSPFLIRDLRSLNRTNVKATVIGGIYMALAVITYVWAIKLSAASYVSVITLVTPIIFIFYSSRFTGEKISSRALAGITLAALGAMVIFVLPIALAHGGSLVFYPWATLFIIINCITFPLTVIYFRKANEGGAPMLSVLSLSSWVVCLLNAICLFTLGTSSAPIGGRVVFGILYSGLIVALITRVVSVVVYERIGSVVSSALSYLETLIAITLPLIVLHEQLSPEVVFGGMLIIAGLYVAQHARIIHPKHRHLLRVP